MPTRTEVTDGEGGSYQELVATARAALAALGADAMEYERLGLGPLSLSEARSEMQTARGELAEQWHAVIAISEAVVATAVDEEALARAADVLQDAVLRLRRLLAPTNAHLLPDMTLAALPFFLENLPELLLALSRIGVGPDLAGRLFMLASEIEFLGVLLSLATDQGKTIEHEGSVATLDRLRGELDSLATAGTPMDVALLRKRLNDALDEVDSADAAVEEVLTRISETSDQIEAQRLNLDHLVSMARERGASWNKIAKAVGVSAQSAHKRWDPDARAKARKYMQEYSAKRRD